MAKNSLKHAVFKLYHSDCFYSEATEKYPLVTISAASPPTILKRGNDQIVYQMLIKARCENHFELEKFIEGIKSFDSLRKSILLKQTANETLLMVRLAGPSSSLEQAIQRNAIYTKPVDAKEGFEIHSVISTSPKHVKNLLSELSELGELKLLKLNDYAFDEPEQDITKKQMDALRVACNRGYYGWPKGITLNDIANELNISRRAAQERLRRAESKILPKLLKDYMVTESN